MHVARTLNNRQTTVLLTGSERQSIIQRKDEWRIEAGDVLYPEVRNDLSSTYIDTSTGTVSEEASHFKQSKPFPLV